MTYDSEFLALLDNTKVKTQYIKLTVLDFDDYPIREIQGSITSGSLNVNGSSAVRRTISLTMFAKAEENNLVNLDNIISLNKKIRVEVGYKNPFSAYQETYGTIVWFKCGTFVVSSATISSSVAGYSISIQGKDKMVMLDGTVGGMLPASVVFSERQIENKDGTYTTEYPTIFQIIQEAVNHYGNEPINNITISGIELTAKTLVKYNGDKDIYFIDDDNHSSYVIADEQPEGYNCHYTYGQDIGYTSADFIYPGDLVLSAGETVASLLDKICKTLGNYEYFYDVDGRFIFQEIKNYLNNSYTNDLLDMVEKDYLKIFTNSKYVYSFTSSEEIVSINNNPKYDNIKNDFIVWGQKSTVSGVTSLIRYHVAVDNKPDLSLCTYYMWEMADEDDNIVRYAYNTTGNQPSFKPGETTATLIGNPSTEWREELYRQALEHQLSSSEEGAYDAELLEEWRKLYDTTKAAWEDTDWWNPNVYEEPSSLNYWLDFIEYEGYSVNQIGRRTKVINDTSIKYIYAKQVPDVIFVENDGNIEELQELIESYVANGQDYCLVPTEQMDMFALSSTGTSCYDKIRELIYQNLTYNSTVNITCLPRYYLEPNQLIYIEDKDSGIQGSYVISQFSLPLQYSGTMSITATEALTRV